MNINNMEKWAVFAGHLRKIEKSITYAFNNVLLNWSTKKVWWAFCLSFKVIFGICYIRKFPYYEPLLWFMIG